MGTSLSTLFLHPLKLLELPQKAAPRQLSSLVWGCGKLPLQFYVSETPTCLTLLEEFILGVDCIYSQKRRWFSALDLSTTLWGLATLQRKGSLTSLPLNPVAHGPWMAFTIHSVRVHS